ncbi:hypothetical protein BKI52_42275 [marine bacterium AO1-C]|nr:hypothetical protein BKI52_42275 [marine bacterium AO1-C]
MRLSINQQAPDFQTKDVLGNPIHLENYQGKKVYIAFLRNASCPLCSLHLYKLTKIVDQLKNKGLELIVFYESVNSILLKSPFFNEYILRDDKFYVVSDNERKYYGLYGAELRPERATPEIFKAAGLLETYNEALRLGMTGNGQEAGTNGSAMPADFLIDEQGIVRYAKYGNNIGDHIDLQLLEDFVK